MKHYILLISGIISVGLSSVLSAFTPFGMENQQVISENFSTIITPAGFTFSIWGLIYASWILFGAYVAYKKIPLDQKSVKLLAGAQIVSTLWLIPSQYTLITLSFLVMIAIFVLLFLLVQSPLKNKYLSYVAQLFFGWIVIASIANLHQTLIALDIYAFPVVFGVLSIIAGLVLNAYFLFKKSYYIPSLVLLWALYGIISAQDNSIIIISSTMAMTLIPLLFALKYFNAKK